jgi:hypothetical protein
MKAIQINTIVNLTNGLAIPSGGVNVISEGLAQVFAQKEGLIPAQIVSNVYVNQASYEDGKAPVDGNSIADFQTALYNLNLSVTNYETQTAQDLLVTTVYDYLATIYAATDLEIINVTAPTPIVTETTEVTEA